MATPTDNTTPDAIDPENLEGVDWIEWALSQ